MSSLLFHPQLRHIILCYLSNEDQLWGYRPINSQSTVAVEDHIKEVVVEHVKSNEVDFAVADVMRQYWDVFCRLGFVASDEFRPTLEKMFLEVCGETDRKHREEAASCCRKLRS